MNLEQYDYKVYNDYSDYVFYSEGPKGRIKKIVRYRKISGWSPVTYNLGFGDENPRTKNICDITTSNNKDREKVLATIASTIVDFTSKHSDNYVFITGSTPARTRLYQMAVSKMFDQISNNFIVYGLQQDAWSLFEHSVNYTSFLVGKK